MVAELKSIKNQSESLETRCIMYEPYESITAISIKHNKTTRV